MDLSKPEEFQKMVDAVRASYLKMRDIRELRSELIGIFAGSEYCGDKSVKTVYINLMAMAVQIFVRQLVARAPSARVTTMHPELRPLAADLTLACDEASDEVKFGRTLRRAAEDALFGMATVKIGLEGTGQQDLGNGEKADLTDPFIDLVSFDDLVWDMSARSAYEPAFVGNKYCITRETFDRLYGDKKQVPKDEMAPNEPENESRAEALTHQTNINDESGTVTGKGKIELWDIWFPQDRNMVTFLANGTAKKPLRERYYEANEEGPYRHLWYLGVPDNAMPLSPLGLLKNVHNLANFLFRKMALQARKNKSTVRFSDEEEAALFSKTLEGDGYASDGPKPENVEVGGIDPQSFGFFLQVKDIFSWAAGNLDSLGGLSPMSETIGQDQMLQQAASAQMADMKDGVVEFASSIMRQIAWYEWTDPVRVRELKKPIKGTDLYVKSQWTPQTRQGDFLKFNTDIVPTSLQDNSPTLKLQKINMFINQYFLPLRDLFLQQGFTIDVRELTALAADLANVPELNKVITSVDPEAVANLIGPIGNPSPQKAGGNSQHTSVRVNRPGATRVGKEQSLMMKAMGGGIQPSEEAALDRSVS